MAENKFSFQNHIAGVLTLREDLHRVITATEQLEPFVRSLAQVIQQMKPERCRLDDPGPMEQICLQINTLEPNSQSRVDAIERQEQQRKQEMERKKQESNMMLATVKRQLKTPVKDPCQKRRSTTDVTVPDQVACQASNGADVVIVGSPPTVPVVVVKEVERDRVESMQVSPGNKHKSGSTCGGGISPKAPHKKPAGDGAQAKLGGSSASLDESFELLLNTMEAGPVSKQQKPATNTEEKKKVDSDKLDGDEEDNVGKPGRSQTLSEGVSVVKTENLEGQPTVAATTISNSLPSLASLGETAVEQGKQKEEPPKVVIPKPPRLPANLIATVAPSTLEARERVLASLKEKVPRIDIGPACNDSD